jgi:hypothetical protein
MTVPKDTSYIDSFHVGISFINKIEAFSFFPEMAGSKEKPWICIIEGISSEFGFQRKFIESKVSNLKPPHSNFKKISWKLYSGFIYEYKNFLCAFDDEQKDLGFFGVSDAGIKTMTKDEIRKTMNMRIKGDTKTESKKSLLDLALNKERMIDEYSKKEKVKKNKRMEQLAFKIGD